MTDVENIKNILNDALAKEKMAEQNCNELLKELEVNGFHDQIEKIKNDERKHQKIVQQLMKMI
jgi:rubrerythrin